MTCQPADLLDGETDFLGRDLEGLARNQSGGEMLEYGAQRFPMATPRDKRGFSILHQGIEPVGHRGLEFAEPLPGDRRYGEVWLTRHRLRRRRSEIGLVPNP